MQTIEDRPYLDRAEQLAMLEDTNSLQAAVTEASQIRRGRALYREAQSKISAWTESIQKIQDQPILDQAQETCSEWRSPCCHCHRSKNIYRAGTFKNCTRFGRRMARTNQRSRKLEESAGDGDRWNSIRFSRGNSSGKSSARQQQLAQRC